MSIWDKLKPERQVDTKIVNAENINNITLTDITSDTEIEIYSLSQERRLKYMITNIDTNGQTITIKCKEGNTGFDFKAYTLKQLTELMLKKEEEKKNE